MIKNKIIELKQEHDARAHWRESEARKKREQAATLIDSAQNFEKIAQKDREEAAQCESALRAMESGVTPDEIKILITFAKTVLDAREEWHNNPIPVHEYVKRINEACRSLVAVTGTMFHKGL
jgi:hypothetical protein